MNWDRLIWLPDLIQRFHGLSASPSSTLHQWFEYFGQRLNSNRYQQHPKGSKAHSHGYHHSSYTPSVELLCYLTSEKLPVRESNPRIYFLQTGNFSSKKNCSPKTKGQHLYISKNLITDEPKFTWKLLPSI